MVTASRVYEAARADAKRFDKQYGTHVFSNEVENVGWAAEWADRREAPKGGIWYADWNDIGGYHDNSYSERAKTLMKRLGDLLEKAGAEIDWSDEVTTCGDCGRLIKTEPDSYGWQPEFVVGDGDITCTDCLDPAEYLRGLADGQGFNSIASIDPTDHGYVRLNEDSYETGFHPGQTDDPKKVAKELVAKGYRRFIFHKDEQSQFYCKWSVYVPADEPEDDDDDSDE